MGKKAAAALCHVLGTLILLLVILACLAVTVPRVMGYEIYHIVTGSMEPEIPVGSLIYVASVPPEEVQEQEIIAFTRDEAVIAHRVLENRVIEGEFITKGDANEQEDPLPVPYSSLTGRVEKHFPYLGTMLVLFGTTVGKVYVIAFAACGAMLNILGGRIRQRARVQDDAENYR